jgi:mannose-6-phosphate isomerase-like protein (cupin superfamily)
MDMLPVDISEAPECIRLGGDTIIVRAASAATDGDLFAVEVRMPPGGGPPVMHRHAPSEVYLVLRGEFTFYLGDPDGGVRKLVAGAGDVVPLAPNAPHTIRNESEQEAVAFSVHAPGGPMEGFSRAAAALADGGPPAMADVLRVAVQHGIELLGPVPEQVVR